MTVLAINKWKTNGELIADCFELGYLSEDRHTLDPTYGHGTFWKVRRPRSLVATDIIPAKSPSFPGGVDFTLMPFGCREFDDCVFDGPYKLNGQPNPSVDERYGIHLRTGWRERMLLLEQGVDECCRVTKGFLLVKCQDQVCSGKKRWQTTMLTERAAAHGFGLVDRFDFLSYRPQPEGRAQVHAHTCSSQLLVFKRGWDSTK